jgi:beta-fructofuranosidase
MAEHPLGPWQLPEGPFLDGAMPCRRYAAKLIKTVSGGGNDCGAGLALIGFKYWGTGDREGEFIGELCDPVLVLQDPVTGLLRLAESTAADPAAT